MIARSCETTLESLYLPFFFCRCDSSSSPWEDLDKLLSEVPSLSLNNNPSRKSAKKTFSTEKEKEQEHSRFFWLKLDLIGLKCSGFRVTLKGKDHHRYSSGGKALRSPHPLLPLTLHLLTHHQLPRETSKSKNKITFANIFLPPMLNSQTRQKSY